MKSSSLFAINCGESRKSSHKYDVENCSKIDRACLDIYTYSSFRDIQKASIDHFICLSIKLMINPRSVNIACSSSSSINVKQKLIVQGLVMESKSAICLLNLFNVQLLLEMFHLCKCNLPRETFPNDI